MLHVNGTRNWLSQQVSGFFPVVKRQHVFISALIFSSLFLIFIVRRPEYQRPELLNPGSPHTPPDLLEPPARPLGIHPVDYLISHARSTFAQVKSRQSTTLEAAVIEYQRRYAITPPPNFDKWYSFAVENGVHLIDEYDAIHEFLLPFWAFSPATLRQRVKEALGADDFVMALFVRAGSVKSVERGPEWKKNAIKDAVQTFASFLPDMDLMFNLHDEPRVVVPHDDLTRLLSRSRQIRDSLIVGQKSPRNAWSSTPPDLNDGFIEPSVITPFNEYAHQFTWTVSRSSCPPDSHARSLNYDGQAMGDDILSYAEAPLNFIRNRTAFTDICNSPSLEQMFGFFNKPNAWSVTHDLLPIFSPSKISSFQDILFPAAWYFADKVVLNETKDMPWDDKRDVMYWRGSTTSGYSDDGIWRRQHRQRFVQQAEKPGRAQILVRSEDPSSIWLPKDIDRDSFRHLFDVHFSSIGQCSPEDCASQSDYFDVRDMEDFQKAWENKYLLDIDGNAFSGRYHAFLRSRCLTLKLALFREWHEEWIAPWVHYIPLNLEGSDHLEIMRYLTEEENGKAYAREIADESRDWAGRALRRVDMQAWMFRLLLEYVCHCLAAESKNEIY
jgi:Glycosyl transferase family 90